MNRQDRPSGLAVLAGLGIAAGTIAAGAIALRRNNHEGADDAPGYTARRGFGKYDVSGRTVTIRKPRSELFAFWRDFKNLVPVMENLERIEAEGDGRTVWTIKAPAGQTVRVETEVVSEEQDKLIAWRSVEGSDIDTEGRVEFEDAPGDRGTRVTLIVAYDPPGGTPGKLLAKLLMREPAIQSRHDLKRFKMLMETGEITTSARRKEDTRAAEQQADHKEYA